MGLVTNPIPAVKAAGYALESYVDEAVEAIDLSGKSDVGHGHTIGDVALLEAALESLTSGKLDVSATTVFSRSLLDDSDAATARTTLGLGSGSSPTFASVVASEFLTSSGQLRLSPFNRNIVMNTGVSDITLRLGNNGGFSPWLDMSGRELQISATIFNSGIVVRPGTLSLQPTVRLWFENCTSIHPDAANTLAQRNGLNPQAYYIYNTYTSASDYERGGMWWGENEIFYGSQSAGSGTSRNVLFRGAGLYLQDSNGQSEIAVTTNRTRIRNLEPFLNTSDLGKSTNPFRNLFLRPSASLTPNANGDLCIEATNNTTLTFKLKGSDGTVRSGTVTLS